MFLFRRILPTSSCFFFADDVFFFWIVHLLYMASFPASVFVPRLVENRAGVFYDPLKTRVLYAEDQNSATAEIEAIENTLGVNPQGEALTVGARIGIAESELETVGDEVTALSADVSAMVPRLVPSGGNAGEVLAKASADDYDLAWVPVSAGNLLDSIFPVGSVFTSGSPSLPALISALGTWERLEGVSLFGASDTDATFTAGTYGGEKTHTLTTAELPSHSHTVDPPSTATSTVGDHTHEFLHANSDGSSGRIRTGGTKSQWWGAGDQHGAGSHSHTVDIAQFNSGNSGSSGAHNNLPPYFVPYMWRRVS
jgi:microcystin-dependent protein